MVGGFAGLSYQGSRYVVWVLLLPRCFDKFSNRVTALQPTRLFHHDFLRFVTQSHEIHATRQCNGCLAVDFLD